MNHQKKCKPYPLFSKLKDLMSMIKQNRQALKKMADNQLTCAVSGMRDGQPTHSSRPAAGGREIVLKQGCKDK